MKNILLIACFLLAQSQTTIACSCEEYLLDLPVQEMGLSQTESSRLSSISDLIFDGILIDIQKVKGETDAQLDLRFKITRYYKGSSNDTITIRTNDGSEACGFTANTGTACIIFAKKRGKDRYYTYRSDCCKSIASFYDAKRYNKYRQFLDAVTDGIDGQYVFYQSRSYWNSGYPDSIAQVEALRFTIENGLLQGEWKLTDRRGRVLEQGTYKNGRQVGTWIIRSYKVLDNDDYISLDKTKKMWFEKGKKVKTTETLTTHDFYKKQTITEVYINGTFEKKTIAKDKQ